VIAAAEAQPEALREQLAAAGARLGAPADIIPQLERPRDPAHGDWASNYALMLARPLGRKPRDVAAALVKDLDVARAGVATTEIAGPGFINFRMGTGALAAVLPEILSRAEQFGRADVGHGQRVNVEFVSANPTGPLHVGHGRQAALGDAIARLLEYTGWRVTREFYYNDSGAQIHNLALSTRAQLRALDGDPVVIPEGGYHGEYIRDIAERYRAAHPDDARGDDLDQVRRFAVSELRSEQDLDLKAFGVRFDVYALESALYREGKVDETLSALQRAGHAYEKDGALWLRTTDFGDDKDRVMRRSPEKGGDPTYFVPDVAYHVTKWERGFRRSINVQGADHHSTVTRVRIGLQALEMGIPEGYPEYVLHQMVTVVRSGEEVKISKRAGSYVTVRDLIDEVGRDAVRWFFLMRKGDSQLIFDVDLARTQSEENPVYYVQMAHARMSGIFRVGGISTHDINPRGVELDVLGADEERELIKALADFPAIVLGAAQTMEPHRVTQYLHDTARLVHTWYHVHRVLDEPEPVRSARLVLARASQIVLANGLGLLGITAPERM
jgi:arginyl-tRNA synthetase